MLQIFQEMIRIRGNTHLLLPENGLNAQNDTEFYSGILNVKGLLCNKGNANRHIWVYQHYAAGWEGIPIAFSKWHIFSILKHFLNDFNRIPLIILCIVSSIQPHFALLLILPPKNSTFILHINWIPTGKNNMLSWPFKNSRKNVMYYHGLVII